MQYKHNLLKPISTALLLAGCVLTQQAAQAALPAKAVLNFTDGVNGCVAGGTYPTCNYNVTTVDPGSYFAMDLNGTGFIEQTRVAMFSSGTGVTLETAQAVGEIDLDWIFGGPNGRHLTLNALATTSTGSANTYDVTMAGWTVNWGAEGNIDMGAGIATLTCAAACALGDTFSLDYETNVPTGAFTGVPYQLHLEGTIGKVNAPPTVSGSAITVNAGGTGTVDVTSTGDDPDGDNANLVAVSLVPGNNGTLSGANTGTITYTNTNTSATSDTFTYKVSDGAASSLDLATVSVTINAIPVANADGASTTPSSTITINLLSNDTDADGNNTIDATSVIEDGSISNGTISINSSGVATYINDGTTGIDTFSYTVADDNGARSNSALVSIDVQADPAPTCNGATLSLNQDTSSDLTVSNFATAGNISKTLDNSTIATSTPSNGGISINTTTGVITYTPTAGYIGSDAFTYTIADDTKTCVAATVIVNVISTNTKPVTNADSISTNAGTAVDIDVTSNDTDDDAITNSTITITNTPSNGTAVVSSGMVTYTPIAGYAGSDSFTYTLTDVESAQSLNATVTVEVVTSSASTPTSPEGVLTCGTTAISVSNTSCVVTTTDIGVDDTGFGKEQGVSQSCIGGCFDFTISGVTVGTQAQVVLPLGTAIPAKILSNQGHKLVYRKLMSTGWQDFDLTDDSIASAAGTISGSDTICPVANDASYINGLTSGDRCVRLTITDGGPNDADGLANGTVVDPGGVSETYFTSGSDGCSMSNTPANARDHADWLLVAAFLTMLGLFRLRNKAQ